MLFAHPTTRHAKIAIFLHPNELHKRFLQKHSFFSLDTELFYKGERVARWENIKLRDMDTIQQMVAGLTTESLATMAEIARV